MNESLDIYTLVPKDVDSQVSLVQIKNVLQRIERPIPLMTHEIKSLCELPKLSCFAILLVTLECLEKISSNDLLRLEKGDLIIAQVTTEKELKLPKPKIVHSRLIVDDMGNLLQSEQILNLIEISELRKTVFDLQLKAERQFKMATLGEMNATLAHEINNPLTIILGQIGLMKKHFPAGEHPKLSDSLLKVERTVGRITKIVKSLKFFSRDDENDSPTVVSLLNVIRDSATVCNERILESNIRFNIEDFNDLEITCKDIQISQILVNLIQNSIDAVEAQESPWIRVICSATPEFVTISITDSGKILDEETKKKMFKAFYTTKLRGRGTGLGLSYSKNIAQEHQGDLLYMADAPNTTFELKLPI